jgi:hypothetical protein
VLLEERESVQRQAGEQSISALDVFLRLEKAADRRIGIRSPFLRATEESRCSDRSGA